MIPERYFPFPDGKYRLQIGASPLKEGEDILEADAHRETELALKRACFAARDHYYFLALPGSEAAQKEAAQLLSQGACEDFRALGDSVQEDLLLLDALNPQVPLIAGHLCFPNAWSLEDKLGRSFLELHAPVPGFAATLGPPSLKLLERLKPERPVFRLNWAVKATAQLDLSTRWSAWEAEQKAQVTAANAGARCFLRVERQTLSRLPGSGAILFTLHTYVQAMETLRPDQLQRLRGVLQTCPAEMLAYKGITPFLAPLSAWLAANTGGQPDQD
jgi:hypothetical protein